MGFGKVFQNIVVVISNRLMLFSIYQGTVVVPLQVGSG